MAPFLRGLGGKSGHTRVLEQACSLGPLNSPCGISSVLRVQQGRPRKRQAYASIAGFQCPLSYGGTKPAGRDGKPGVLHLWSGGPYGRNMWVRSTGDGATPGFTPIFFLCPTPLLVGLDSKLSSWCCLNSV